jgi:hypothetical protein
MMTATNKTLAVGVVVLGLAMVNSMAMAGKPSSRKDGNPVVAGTPSYYTGTYYYPSYNGHYAHTTYGERVHASAYDPYRGYADPGSVQHVNRYVSDGNGNYHYERGWAWTSNGVPHSDTYETTGYSTSPWSSQHDTIHRVKALGR